MFLPQLFICMAIHPQFSCIRSEQAVSVGIWVYDTREKDLSCMYGGGEMCFTNRFNTDECCMILNRI